MASLRHEPQTFPERDTLDSGIEGHHWNASCTFEESLGNLAPNTGLTKSRARDSTYCFFGGLVLETCMAICHEPALLTTVIP
jgi:hypothetical protein